ncbi:hypothetical protein K8U54_14855 [Pseudomonas fulva]|uniref:N,N-dimethylformamidase beta subunit family domain-containing protein n=1 Tax=Pseudomonas fulva TaxID=47880 RepID=UPI00201D92CE|nr:N,N-dimethylformamidase beta subunit family domain-containing protein [Pseudomonas fulva]UQY33010.1 hypothetical protein K8U54_14855 [Pseudomonas fulva]
MNNKITGYLSHLSVLAGDQLSAYLSGCGSAEIQLHSLHKAEDRECSFKLIPDIQKIEIELEKQTPDTGSCFDFEVPLLHTKDKTFEVSTWMLITKIEASEHALAALNISGAIYTLMVTSDGIFWKNPGYTSESVAVPVGEWFRLVITCEANGVLHAGSASHQRTKTSAPRSDNAPTSIRLGRDYSRSGNGSYCKFEGPRIIAVNGADDSQSVVASFDFTSDFSTQVIRSTEGAAIEGKFINHPTRRIIGHHRPNVIEGYQDIESSAYTAVHCHRYDLTDANWEPSATFSLPKNLKSGIYTISITSGGESLHLPFVVRAHADTREKILLILPTYTYLAYANERLAFSDRGEALCSETDGMVLSELDHYLDRQKCLGASLYDRHSDGSGVHYSSRHRPILNLSSDYKAWWCTNAPRHFLADLNIAKWLEHIQQPFDVATDEDLHTQGQDLLDAYKVVLTGTHPEYVTTKMLAAWHGYAHKGKIMYLGANGFYWVTGADPENTGIIEARRGYSGTRNWNSDPLELRLSSTGETGGLWRHRGLAPNELTGVGFAAVGFSKASSYSRVCFSEKYAHLFEGVTDPIGDHGYFGGAAGDELDATNFEVGTPKETVILARSTHGRSFMPSIEEELEIQHELGGDRNSRVRSEVCILERKTGGKVFSASSINWCGSLDHRNYKNSVAQLTTNVLLDFLSEPTPHNIKTTT